MGLFDRFRKPQSEPDEQPRETIELAPDEVGPWIEAEFGGRVSDALDKLESVSSEVVSGIGEMLGALEELDKAAFKGDPRMDSRVNMIKNSFVTKARAGLSSLSGPKDRNYRELRGFLTGARKVMNEAAGASNKQGFVLSKYFQAQGKDFSQAFQRVNSRLDDLRDGLNKDYSFVGDVDSAKESLGIMLKSIKQAKFLEQRFKDIQLRVKEVENSMKNQNSRLEELKKSEEWLSLDEMRNTREKLLKEAGAIERELAAVGGVTRVIKKMAHTTGEKDVERLAERPVKVFGSLSDDKIKDIFNSAARAVEKDELKVKESDRKHLKAFMERLPRLLESRERLAQIRKDIQNKEKSIASADVVKKFKITEHAIIGLEKELKTLNEEEKEIKTEIEKTKKTSKEQKEVIEGSFSKHGYKLRVEGVTEGF